MAFQRSLILLTCLAVISSFVTLAPALIEDDCGGSIVCILSGKYKSLETIEILPPDPKFIFSMTDGNEAAPHFPYIRAQVRITPTGVTAETGELIAYAMYKERTDFDINLANDPPTAASRAENFTFLQSAPYPVTSLNATPQDFIFDFSRARIPVGITDLYFGVFLKGVDSSGNFLMFYGTLDLNEPMHFVSFNSTDYVYCQSQLYTAQEFNDQNLWDTCEYTDIDPVTDLGTGLVFVEDFDNPIPNVNDAYAFNMPAPSYSRLILLLKSDRVGVAHNLYSERLNPDNGNPYLITTGIMNGVVNQEKSDGTFQSTGVSEFRGIRYHMAGAGIVGMLDFPDIMDAAWPSLGDSHKTAIQFWK